MEKLNGLSPPFRELLLLTPPVTTLSFSWGRVPLLTPRPGSPVASVSVCHKGHGGRHASPTRCLRSGLSTSSVDGTRRSSRM